MTSDLEALLPGTVAGVRLVKASATGASVFGGDAFGRSLTTFLRSVGREPSDLAFANAADRSGAGGLELGVFDLPGVAGSRLLEAIVGAGRPDAPGLAVAEETLAGD